MFERPYLTKYHQEDTEKLRRLSAKNDADAKMELVLRSMFTVDKKKVVTADEAIQLCKQFLQNHPTYNFFLWALACHARKKETATGASEPTESLHYFRLAAQSEGPIKELKKDILHKLAHVCYAANKYIEGHAWMVKNILLGSGDATIEFLDVILDKPRDVLNSFPLLQKMWVGFGPQGYEQLTLATSAKRALSACAFLVVMGSNRLRFRYLKDSLWLHAWEPKIQAYFIDAHARKDGFQQLDDPQSSVHQIARLAILNNPVVFQRFFAICNRNKIIPSALFIRLMNFYFSIIDEQVKDKKVKQTLIDAAQNSLFIHYARANETELADSHFRSISPAFVLFSGLQLNTLTPAARDYWSYACFKRVFANKELDNSLKLLQIVEDAKYFDSTVLDFFAAQDPQQIKFRIYETRRDCLARIQDKHKNGVVYDSFFIARVNAELAVLDNPLTELRYQLHHMIFQYLDYMDIRDHLKERAAAIRYQKGEPQRQTFLNNALKFQKDVRVNGVTAHSLTELKDFFAAFSEEVASWINSISGTQTTNMIKSVQSMLKLVQQTLHAYAQQPEKAEKDFQLLQESVAFAAQLNTPPPPTFSHDNLAVTYIVPQQTALLKGVAIIDRTPACAPPSYFAATAQRPIFSTWVRSQLSIWQPGPSTAMPLPPLRPLKFADDDIDFAYCSAVLRKP